MLDYPSLSFPVGFGSTFENYLKKFLRTYTHVHYRLRTR